jgi:hypothetical protein
VPKSRRWIEEMTLGEAEPPPRWFVDNLADTDTEMVALELDGWSTAVRALVSRRRVASVTDWLGRRARP